MSEYHAAVGLAALDGWQEKRAAFSRLKDHYADAIAKAGLSVYALSLSDSWVCSTLNLRLSDESADQVIRQLNPAGVESRKWWGGGCHLHPAYMIYPKTELPITEKLGGSVLAVPFAVGMTQAEVNLVVGALGSIMQTQRPLQARAYA